MLLCFFPLTSEGVFFWLKLILYTTYMQMIYTQIRNFLPSVHSLIKNNGAVQAIIKVRTIPDSIPEYKGLWFEYTNNLDLYCETKYGWIIVEKCYDSPFYRIVYYLAEDKDKERALKELIRELIKLNKDSMKMI